MSTTNVLRRSITLLKKGWCKFSLAEDSDGNPTWVDNKEAVKFCARGAILKANNEDYTQALKIENLIQKFIPTIHTRLSSDLVNFNNAQTSPEPILKAFHQAYLEARRLPL